MKPYSIHKYSIKKFPFYALLSKCLGYEYLGELHNQFTTDHDSATAYKQKFNQDLERGWENFEEKYTLFIKEVVEPLVSEELVYPKWPTLEIHPPKGNGTPEFKRNQEEGTNFTIPLTPSYETNAVWAESEPNKGDFQPLEGGVGDLFLFNGDKCLHGNKTNLTDSTRVSLDFQTSLCGKREGEGREEELFNG